MQAIRRALSFLSLVLVLTGPFLGQVEAAESLARSLAELVEVGVIEPAETDGGDVPGAFSIRSEVQSAADLGFDVPAPLDGLVFDGHPASSPTASLGIRPHREKTVRSASPASRRQARLQVFLF